jgi:GNAT superfamily N-acetyltransferase
VLPGSDGRRAESAFTVEEDYQGKGLASLLLHHLSELGRARGWQALEAEVLAWNTPMLRVFAESGLPMTSHRNEDTVHVTLVLSNGEKPA